MASDKKYWLPGAKSLLTAGKLWLFFIGLTVKTNTGLWTRNCKLLFFFNRNFCIIPQTYEQHIRHSQSGVSPFAASPLVCIPCWTLVWALTLAAAMCHCHQPCRPPQAPHRVLLLSFPLAEVGRFKGPCKMCYQGIKSHWHWLLSPQLTLILPVNSRVSLMGEADAVSPSFPGKNAIIWRMGGEQWLLSFLNNTIWPRVHLAVIQPKAHCSTAWVRYDKTRGC